MTDQPSPQEARSLLYDELNRPGGDPSNLFEVLEAVVETRAWQTLTDDDGNPIGSLQRLIEAPRPAGCGQPIDKVLALLRIEHRYERENNSWAKRMKALRQAIENELAVQLAEERAPQTWRVVHTAAPPADEMPAGRPAGKSKEQVLKRLEEDERYDLLEKVSLGELSATAAAVEAGYRLRRVTVPIGDTERTAQSLRHHLDDDALRALIGRLDELLEGGEQ